jgi:hypothetical protein|tara:strand:- start:132 stop:239 length:108 start_codon:yes stop_codon:yes gene_type:complete
MNFKKLFKLELPTGNPDSKIGASERVSVKKGVIID